MFGWGEMIEGIENRREKENGGYLVRGGEDGVGEFSPQAHHSRRKNFYTLWGEK